MNQRIESIANNRTKTLNRWNIVGWRNWRPWLLAVFAAWASWRVQAQPVPDWSVITANAAASALAIDGGNNSFVSGFDPAGSSVLTKVSPAGVVLWQRDLMDAARAIRVTSVTADAAGHAIVTGRVVDAAGTSQGPALLRFDPAGNLLWQVITPSTYSYAWRAVVDAAGNVFVLASMTQALAGGGLASDLILTRYSHAGVPQWSRSFRARVPSIDPIIVTTAGNIVVAGLSSGGAGTILAAFDPEGTMLWSAPVASNGPLSLAAGHAGAFYAVGDGGTLGYFVVQFDTSFNQVWRNTYPARGVASRAMVDSVGNIVVIGSVDTNTGPLTVLMNDWLTIKLDAAGTMLWAASHGSAAWVADIPSALALGPDDAVYITGEGSTPVTDGAGNISVRGILATVKYTPGGTPIWVANRQEVARGVSLRVSHDGGVMVLGDTPQTLLRYPQSGMPNQPPVAVASAGPSLTGPAPLTVTFSAAGSLDPDGIVVGTAWNFGDGQTSTEAKPSHVYAEGQWTAQLTVTDSLGASSSAAPILITANAPAVDPAKPRSLTFAKSSVPEGSGTLATVTVSNRSGVTVALSSKDTNVATVPAIVIVPAGQISATFLVSTLPVRKDTRVTIRATANGVTVSNTLTVRNL